MLNLLLNGQENLIVLLCAFIIGGTFKTRNLFVPVFYAMMTRVRSKRLSVFLVSLISGVLPIEGRVSISAPILDSLMRKDPDNPNAERSRGKLGILDYIATHHYYLWSPLEKSIILIMAGLHLTYAQVLSYTVVPLFLYVMYLAAIVFFYLEEEEININMVTDTPTSKMAFFNILPFILGIGWSIVYPPYFVFPIVAFYYVLKNKVEPKELLGFVNWKALITVASIIILANFVKDNQPVIVNILNGYLGAAPDEVGWRLFSSAILVGALTSLILGSSSKYAGITVAVTLLLGMKYFPFIFMVEYTAYLLSPTHKCLAISAGYFKTSPLEFYKRIGVLGFFMLLAGVCVTLA